MEKRLYGKPLMSVERFTPSEYVSLCWYIANGDCYGTLYCDTKRTDILIDYIFGIYDNGEQVSDPSHGSHRVPAETAHVRYIKANNLPVAESSYNYYTSWDYG